MPQKDTAQEQAEAMKRRLAKQKQQQKTTEPEWEKAMEPVQIVGTN